MAAGVQEKKWRGPEAPRGYQERFIQNPFVGLSVSRFVGQWKG